MPREGGASSTPRRFDRLRLPRNTGSPACAGDGGGARRVRCPIDWLFDM